MITMAGERVDLVMDQGYVKLWRKVKDSAVFADPALLKVFVNSVGLYPLGSDVVDVVFEQAHAVVASPDEQPHDGVAVDAIHALDATDGAALDEGRDHLDLLVTGKTVHGASPYAGQEPAEP